MPSATIPGAVELRPAGAADLNAIEQLLSENGLPTAGVSEELQNFVVAESDGRIVGAIGVEVYDSYGLLRSAAVRPDVRGAGVGRRLVERILADAEGHGLEELFLLTTTAERYFPRFGFEHCTRDDVPGAVKRSVEFRGACPDTAVVMRRKI
jgi:amino-acid N-acetyltransferase